ncbi:tetratricopeptide repeat protein [Vibrio pectenicida]|uniref:Tetratricopeptide repeat protein n=2 Tax=Vibrio pectenicida TaxID=62763 RepID=A0A7Y3ZYD8_9VIBR|nr:tetratricopeptide repeat protein [Vibrio pectenicida]
MRLFAKYVLRTEGQTVNKSQLYKILLVAMMGMSVSKVTIAADSTSIAFAQELASITRAKADHIDPHQRVASLSYRAQNVKQPKELRIEALRELANYPSQNALVAVVRSLQDYEPTIREAAIVGAAPYAIEYRWRMLEPLLTDRETKVRITAATDLVRDFANLKLKQQQRLEKPVAELITYLQAEQDQNSQLLLADVYRWHHEWGQADKIYQMLAVRQPDNPEVWLSLADNYRAQEQDSLAIQTLNNAIKLNPDNAALHYSKSLALVRLDDKKTAAIEIEQAAKIAEDNSYFWYLNGVLQEDYDLKKSVKSFEQAYLISGAPEQLYAVCDIYARYENPKTDQCLSELEKVAPQTVINGLKQN